MADRETSTTAGTLDEAKLETDAVYRFRYLAAVIGLDEADRNLLQKHRQLIEPQLPAIVDRVYQKMFQFDAMKRHFLSRHTGFDGMVPSSFSDLGLDQEQTVFRKMRLREYFTKLCTAKWDETFAVLIDLVGHMHTQKEGNSHLNVPIIQVTALLAVINDLFLKAISELELSVTTQLLIQRIYTKLFWVQNCMFIRHWTS